MKRFGLVLLVWVMTGLVGACSENAAANGSKKVAIPVVPGDPVAGEQVFIGSCSSCHGTDARGLPGLSKDLVTSTYVGGMNEEQFLEFVKTGRSPSDPANTTGVEMPANGGNPALRDEDFINIRAYLFSLR
ncbi:MAG: c-type cytochrome [Chloroflexi bacterium]|nr:c-type cytochrome [Chloroflexota bacterium]MBP8054605.1 c-type cytochrome [Chloroflexota bacterium]